MWLSNWFPKVFKRKRFKHFGYRVVEFDLPTDGKVEFAQWLHEAEKPVVIDQNTVDFYRQFVKPGSLAIDIGTHTGDTTVPMALAAGKDGLVLGLEPNPHVYHVFEKNASLNTEKTNIVPLHFAATATDGEYTFASGDASFNNGGITGFSTNIKKNIRFSFKVKGRNLEQFLKREYSGWIEKLCLIKIDAEGYDKEILKTIPGLIKRTKPVLITECFKQLKASERFELFDVINAHGYTLFFADEYGQASAQPITRDRMNVRKHFDFIAVPN